MRTTRRKVKPWRILALLTIAVIIVVIIATLIDAIGASRTKDSLTTNADESVSESIAVSAEPAVEYKNLGEFTLTAYCPCVQCCGVWSAEHPSRIGTGYIQKTASGTIPTEGRTIGVDPSVIPFGTAVVINGHEYIAEDRGGAVQGNVIDIFFVDHNEALAFGRQSAEVFIKAIKED